MIIYRIAKKKFLNSLDGLGAFLHGGRWTPIGTYAVYTAEHRSLAYLEYVVHQMGLSMWPADLGIAIIELEEKEIYEVAVEELPKDWGDLLLQDYTKELGANLFSEGHLAISIPSVIVPEERNIIINPIHHDFRSKVSIKQLEDLSLDECFISG